MNSVCFAPHELGLILACGSSDGSISVLYNTGKNRFLTLCILMDFPIHIDTLYKYGTSHCVLEGVTGKKIEIMILFLSSKVILFFYTQQLYSKSQYLSLMRQK